MRYIQMQEIESLEVDILPKCKYCGKILESITERVDVIDPRTNRIRFFYCQTSECMRKYLDELYG